MVFTPPQVSGLQASVDWFHIKITNAIERANTSEVEQNCAGGDAAACSQIVFDTNYYDPATGAIVAPGTPGAVTGAAAWRQGGGRVLNATTVNATSHNGAFYDERGMDFSLSQLVVLPDGSNLVARVLATWTGEQVFQSYAGGPTISILGQTGAANNFLNDNNPAARWTGNMSITWTKGGFSLTPNMRFVGGRLALLHRHDPGAEPDVVQLDPARRPGCIQSGRRRLPSSTAGRPCRSTMWAATSCSG